MSFNKPIGGIECCMCPDDEYIPATHDTYNKVGTIYYCQNCGKQLTFKRVDEYGSKK